MHRAEYAIFRAKPATLEAFVEKINFFAFRFLDETEDPVKTRDIENGLSTGSHLQAAKSMDIVYELLPGVLCREYDAVSSRTVRLAA